MADTEHRTYTAAGLRVHGVEFDSGSYHPSVTFARRRRASARPLRPLLSVNPPVPDLDVLPGSVPEGPPSLVFGGLFDRLRAYFAGAGTAYVVAPFIRADVLAALLEARSAPVVVLTSWRPDHLLAGASDLGVYALCRERGWALYTSDSLHAKVYSLDLASAWVGSANVTRRALGLAGVSNDEVLTLVDPLMPEVQAWVFRLLQAAQRVTDEHHARYAAWLAEQPPLPSPPVPPAVPDAARDPFSVGELPATSSPRRLWEVLQAPEAANPAERAAAEHDLAVYRVPSSGADYDGFRRQLAMAFGAHPFVAELLAEVDACSGPEHAERPGLQFGVVKEWVRARCTDEPAPHRGVLTEPVDRVFAWCDELLAPDYEVFTPGARSRVLRRRPSAVLHPPLHS